MAKAPQAAPTPTAEEALPKASVPFAGAGVRITYIPRFNGDPFNTTVEGVRFEANKPRLVSNPAIIAMAKTNSWFKVGDSEPAPLPTYGKPQSDVEYRRYAIEWMQKAKSSDEIKRRWDAEEDLRSSCDIGTEDLDFLAPYYSSRVEQLVKAEKEASNAIS